MIRSCLQQRITLAAPANLFPPTLVRRRAAPRLCALSYSNGNVTDDAGQAPPAAVKEEKHVMPENQPTPTPVPKRTRAVTPVHQGLLDRSGVGIPWTLLITSVLPESVEDGQQPGRSDDLVLRISKLIQNGSWDRAALIFDTMARSHPDLYDGSVILQFSQTAAQKHDSRALVGLVHRFVQSYFKGHDAPHEIVSKSPRVSRDDLVQLISVLIYQSQWEWALVLFDAALAQSPNVFQNAHLLKLCSDALRCSNIKALTRVTQELFNAISKQTTEVTSDEKRVFRDSFLSVMQLYFSHEKYLDVLNVHNQMLDLHISGDIRTFLVILQSRMRLHRHAGLAVETLGLNVTTLSSDIVNIVAEMHRQDVYINSFHRSVILNGYLDALLSGSSKGRYDTYRVMALLEELKKTLLGGAHTRQLQFQKQSWGDIGPHLHAQRVRHDGQIFNLAWAEATQKALKLHLKPARISTRGEPEMLKQISHWHNTVIERLPSLDPSDPSNSERSIKMLLRDAQLHLIQMRAHLFRIEFDEAFRMLKSIHAVYHVIVARAQSTKRTPTLLIQLDDITRRFASALIGFVGTANGIQNVRLSLDALEMSGTLKDMPSFCRLWRRLFALQSMLKLPWEGESGLKRSLISFEKQLIAYNEGRRAEKRPSSGRSRQTQPSLGDLQVVFSYDVVIQQMSLAAWHEPDSAHTVFAALGEHAGQAARLGLLVDVHWRCGIMFTDESWFPPPPGYSAYAFEELRRLYEKARFLTTQHIVPYHEWPSFQWQDALPAGENSKEETLGQPRRRKGASPVHFTSDGAR